MHARPIFLLPIGVLVLAIVACESGAGGAEAPQGNLVYQIFVRSFADSDDADTVGDLKGITGKLDTYLNDGNPDLHVRLLLLTSHLASVRIPATLYHAGRSRMTSAVVRMSPRSATAFFCATAGPRRATLAPVAATFTRWPLPRPPPHTWPSRVVHRLFVAPGEFLEGGDDPTQGNRPLGLWQLRVRHLGPEVKEYLQGVRHSASPDLGRVSRADEVPACRPGRGGSPHSAMCSGRTPSDSWPGRATPPRAGATGASGSHTSDPSPLLALDEEGYEGGEQTQRSQEHCLRDVQGPQRVNPDDRPRGVLRPRRTSRSGPA